MMPPTKPSSSSVSLQAAISAAVEQDASEKKKAEKEKKEAEKKASADDEVSQTLEQQETMKISGTNARHMVMQKLMRQSQVSHICFGKSLAVEFKRLNLEGFRVW